MKICKYPGKSRFILDAVVVSVKLHQLTGIENRNKSYNKCIDLYLLIGQIIRTVAEQRVEDR